MASIKGVSIKNRRSFNGHEGERCDQGDICYNGKKIGYFSDNTMSGFADIKIDASFKEVFANAVKDYYAKNPQADDGFEEEIFIYDLNVLMDKEKKFKSLRKKGCALAIEGDAWFSVLATEENLGLYIKNNPTAELYSKDEDFVIK